jgi:hypothetical protein
LNLKISEISDEKFHSPLYIYDTREIPGYQYNYIYQSHQGYRDTRETRDTRDRIPGLRGEV